MAPKKKSSPDRSLTDIKGVGKARARKLKKAGFASVESVAQATPQKLAESGMSESFAKKIISSAKKLAPGASAKKSSTNKRSVRVTKETPVSPPPKQPVSWARVSIAALVVLVVAGMVFWAAGGFPEQVSVTSEPVVVVNGVEITAAELEQQYSGLPDDLQQRYTREEILVQLVDKELILQYAAELGIEVSDADAEARIDEQTAELGITREQLRSVLAGSNVTYDEYLEAVREEAVLEELLVVLGEEVEVSDEEVRALYESIPEEQREPFEQMREDLEQMLIQQQASNQISQLLTDLRADASIEYFGAYSHLGAEQ